ncbi:MAG TPA: enolase C-terminal domain-like protein [Elusimicrobiota bacterium]|nr:enolase C-terminal domain-like protein [Elusimicrobiota bacterium]
MTPSVAAPAALVPLEGVRARAYAIPTESPESDGTLEWRSTTIVVVEAAAGGLRGLGYTYADEAAARLADSRLAGALAGLDAWAVPAARAAMEGAVRNLGRQGLCAAAISAVDAALWDLKARLLGVPLARLLGAARESVPVYGSGGFTSYTIAQLERQLGGWADEGMGAVKMKVGREPERDLERVRAARRAIGPSVELYVDANGAYERKQALRFAEEFAAEGVTWFEEPVPASDLEGHRLLRDRAPAGMEIASGEYGWDLPYFERMLEAGAVDVLQADATRCGGPSGFLEAAALCRARNVPLSSHTAPALHLPLACSAPSFRRLEWFHDHVRIERLLFDGAPSPRGGLLRPDLSRPGFGLELKTQEARRYAVHGG